MNIKIKGFFRYLFLGYTYLICVHLCICVWAHMCAGRLMEIRGQLVGAGSPCQSPCWIFGPQTWQQSAEPCC